MRYVLFTFFFYGVVAVWAQVDTYLDISVQNDFLNYRGHGTDRYYTGGNHVSLLWLAPLKKIPVHYLTVAQRLYTPDDLQDTALRYLDYPYAGLLFFSYRMQDRIASSPVQWALSTSWGYSGRRSGARQTQQFLHRAIGDEIPVGWGHIVENGFFGQFSLLAGQSLYNKSHTSVTIFQEVEWGSVFQRIRWAIQFFQGQPHCLPAGSFNFFPITAATVAKRENIAISKRSIAAFFTPTISWVIKNRLLEENSVVPPNESRVICRRMGGLEFGLSLRNRKTVVQFVQYLQQREFIQAKPHAFGEISLLFPLGYKSQ